MGFFSYSKGTSKTFGRLPQHIRVKTGLGTGDCDLFFFQRSVMKIQFKIDAFIKFCEILTTYRILFIIATRDIQFDDILSQFNDMSIRTERFYKDAIKFRDSISRKF